jgi:cell division septation protein DedD
MSRSPAALSYTYRIGAVLRVVACVAILGVLAGCAGHPAQVSAPQEAARYVAQAKRDYRAPGPATDPWGPYIVEASRRYDVPERWIREVMRQESGGRLYEDGQLITSNAGAMGLMQVMPETYDELRSRYSLGDDPFDPHDNIMAGAAYIREMYDAYGTPGFLAAYNAGPARLDDYLHRNRPLPDETRHYVARIGPQIAGVYPDRPSQASQYAMLQLPTNIPPGPRYPRPHGAPPVALAANVSARSGWTRGDVQTAALPEPPQPPPAPAMLADARSPHGFHLIPHAMADTLPMRAGAATGGGWAIQVGAFGNFTQARTAAEAAKGRARDLLAGAQPVVGSVQQHGGLLYRARLTGLSRDAALQACERLGGHGCIVVSPDAQS